MIRSAIIALALTTTLTTSTVLAAALSTEQTQQSAATSTASTATTPTTTASSAIAVIVPTKGNQAVGSVSFVKVEGGVEIIADIMHLTPGTHGFHIHEFGDCSAADATSAGAHFNPYDKPHGGPGEALHHAGDLGNLIADPSGNAHYEHTDATLSLDGPNSIIGRSIVIHANTDDLQSQPAGNSGARIGCGVIGIANLKK